MDTNAFLLPQNCKQNTVKEHNVALKKLNNETNLSHKQNIDPW